jgi:hypothetical protein
VTLNAEDLAAVREFLGRYEPDKSRREQLLSSLKDYIDADSQLSLGGAEQQEYLKAGMLAPTNDFLRTEMELNRVFGWREWLAQHPDLDIHESFSMARFAILNFNTMPKALLVNYLGMTEVAAANLVAERRTNPFHSIDDFKLRSKLELSLNEEACRFLPGKEMRIRIWSKGGGQARLISLQLTPIGLLGPWLVDYEYSVESGEDNSEALAIRSTDIFSGPLGDELRGH